MQVVDDPTGARAFQVMVEMRDGTRLNTFVFLPGSGGPRWPGHPTSHALRHHRGRCARKDGLHAGMAAECGGTSARFDPAGVTQYRRACYAAVYQDTRGRHGSKVICDC